MHGEEKTQQASGRMETGTSRFYCSPTLTNRLYNLLTVSPLAEVLTRSRVGERYLYLTTFTLVTGLAILSGCSTYEKEAQLPPLVRAERQLATTEKISSDPQQKAAEILSIARTAAKEIPKTTGESKSDSEQSIGIYNRAAADLAVELPELTRGRDSLEVLTIQNRKTGEIYRLRIGSSKRGEYSCTSFQEVLDAPPVTVRNGGP